MGRAESDSLAKKIDVINIKIRFHDDSAVAYSVRHFIDICVQKVIVIVPGCRWHITTKQQENKSALVVSFSNQFLAEKHITVIPYSHYSPAMDPFILIPNRKNDLKGHNFDITDNSYEYINQASNAIPIEHGQE